MQEDWQTYYKSLEDPNSSNLYIQGFLPTDSEEVGNLLKVSQIGHPTDTSSLSRRSCALVSFLQQSG